MGSCIGEENVVVRVSGNAKGGHELAILFTLASKLTQVVTIAFEDLNAVVASISDGNFVGRGQHRNAFGGAKCTIAFPPFARAEKSHERAIDRELRHAVPRTVRHKHCLRLSRAL